MSWVRMSTLQACPPHSMSVPGGCRRVGLGRLFVSCTYGKVAMRSGVLEAAHSGNHI